MGWEFAGWGSAARIDDLDGSAVEFSPLGGTHHKLGQWRATAICGNDITSSCLYVAALSAGVAGHLAPIALLIVAAVLYLFRKIYAEVGSALPLNGGTYTLLLNCTNKRVAAGAACLTLLSYVATAVISAGEASHYAHSMLEGLPIFWATIGLLAFFAALNLIGITESAVVALAIFIIHMLTLTILCVASGITIASSLETFQFNWQLPPPGGFGRALFLGFGAAMLGISGFESSANFIEDQDRGVFPKTLRNMWLAVAIFNPLISFLALGLVPLSEITEHQTNLLAEMGRRAAGPWLATLVSVDAVLVLSGAVLTSYVGVTGLMRRMSLDRCLPQFLLRENRARHTNHWIILGFFGLCASILVITSGEVTLLGGVYTLSFLSVMALFAIGNILLKVRRARLPRETRASWAGVIIALAAVIVGLVANLSPENVRVFATYLAVAGAAVGVMFLRVQILRVILFVSESVLEKVNRAHSAVRQWVGSSLKRINELTIVYFTKGDDLPTLNRAALYALDNEQSQRLRVVHVYEHEEDIPPELAEHLRSIDHMYPQLRVDFVAVRGTFGPELIEALSQRLEVPKNYMFIGTPGDRFPHRLETLGGVRVVI
ncbi:MAG: APC family permease [Deltaproteobacteria bacterium]|nr:APC family permease [Deltaproteobacteria bacterium]MCB9786006.1 APC family permease [Deltaproteobacteria bacterium]